MSQGGSFGHGTGGGAGKANVQNISFTKYLDKSTTSFIKALVTGAHIGTATLFVSKAGGKQEDYFTIKLTSAMVTSYSTGGSGGEDMLRSEEHTSELQSLMRISYAVFCLKKKNTNTNNNRT